jgi:hypothetical protein
MGVVIRPTRFVGAARRSSALPARRRRRRMVDGRLAALAVAGMGLAWILALAGTAFAVRAMVVLCFAAIAGRARSTAQ